MTRRGRVRVFEATRYGELDLRQQAEEIEDLAVRPEYPLIVPRAGEANVTVGFYRPSFSYTDRVARSRIIEDLRPPTPIARLERAIFSALDGIDPVCRGRAWSATSRRRNDRRRLWPRRGLSVVAPRRILRRLPRDWSSITAPSAERGKRSTSRRASGNRMTSSSTTRLARSMRRPVRRRAFEADRASRGVWRRSAPATFRAARSSRGRAASATSIAGSLACSPRRARPTTTPAAGEGARRGPRRRADLPPLRPEPFEDGRSHRRTPRRRRRRPRQPPRPLLAGATWLKRRRGTTSDRRAKEIRHDVRSEPLLTRPTGAHRAPLRRRPEPTDDCRGGRLRAVVRAPAAHRGRPETAAAGRAPSARRADPPSLSLRLYDGRDREDSQGRGVLGACLAEGARPRGRAAASGHV